MRSWSRLIKEGRAAAEQRPPTRRLRGRLPGAPGSPEALRGRARMDADLILEQARREAEALATEARSQAETLREKGRQEGYDRGLQLGLEEAMAEARQRFQEEIGRVWSVADSLEAQRRRVLEEAQQEIFELALAVARRIVDGEIQARPAWIADLVARAVAEAEAGGALVIRVHPQDLRTLREHGQLDHEGGRGRWKLVAHPAVEPGGCIVETGGGQVDAQPETQLQRIREILQAAAAG